eukprot:3424760-Amphidinium_carterae.2
MVIPNLLRIFSRAGFCKSLAQHGSILLANQSRTNKTSIARRNQVQGINISAWHGTSNICKDEGCALKIL